MTCFNNTQSNSPNRRSFFLGSSALAGLLIATAWARPSIAQGKFSDAALLLTGAFNASGRQLYTELAKRPGNIVFSPYSIGTAMAMALSGARGTTEEELTKVLMHRLTRPEIEAASGEVMAILKQYDTSADPHFCPAGARWSGQRCEAPPSADNKCRLPMQLRDGQCASGPTLVMARLLVANALMLAEHGDLISADYRTLVKERYAAEVFSGASLDQINDWVKQKTEGKIDKILETLGRDPVLVLLNAVYFNAAWSVAFAKNATRDAIFHVSPTAQMKTPTMHQEIRFPVLKGPGYRAIALPYANPALAMIVVLPDQLDGLTAVSGRLSADALSKLLATIVDQPVKPVALALPRFKAGLEIDLIPPFKAAGLNLALSDDADFSGMTGKPVGQGGVKIGQIRHRAVIEVMEEGTEAAAATAVAAVKSIAVARPEAPPEPFVVDRPFMFFIVDTATRAILFQGRIADPSRPS
jgi:serpin B